MRRPRKPCEVGLDVGRNLITWAEYHALTLVQRPLGYVFWLIEQRKGRLQDRIAGGCV